MVWRRRLKAAGVGSLRLVDALPAAVHRAREEAVARANKDAAELPLLTAQSLFAANVANALEGGPAAVLPADTRRRLVLSAGRIGIREFDAHLIIAMVQERTRAAAPSARPAARTPRLHNPELPRTSQSSSHLRLLAASILLAGILLAATVLWFLTMTS